MPARIATTDVRAGAASVGLGHIGVIDSSQKSEAWLLKAIRGGLTMNKLTIALALTVVVGTMSGLLTLAVATATLAMLCYGNFVFASRTLSRSPSIAARETSTTC